MRENLHYESVYFKGLHNNQEHYWPTIYRAGAAVVSTTTSFNLSLTFTTGNHSTTVTAANPFRPNFDMNFSTPATHRYAMN